MKHIDDLVHGVYLLMLDQMYYRIFRDNNDEVIYLNSILLYPEKL